jgi:hypothetical protein
MLGEFRAEHPRVQLSLISGNTEHIVDAVVRHEISLSDASKGRREAKMSAKRHSFAMSLC